MRGWLIARMEISHERRGAQFSFAGGTRAGNCLFLTVFEKCLMPLRELVPLDVSSARGARFLLNAPTASRVRMARPATALFAARPNTTRIRPRAPQHGSISLGASLLPSRVPPCEAASCPPQLGPTYARSWHNPSRRVRDRLFAPNRRTRSAQTSPAVAMTTPGRTTSPSGHRTTCRARTRPRTPAQPPATTHPKAARRYPRPTGRTAHRCKIAARTDPGFLPPQLHLVVLLQLIEHEGTARARNPSNRDNTLAGCSATYRSSQMRVVTTSMPPRDAARESSAAGERGDDATTPRMLGAQREDTASTSSRTSRSPPRVAYDTPVARRWSRRR